MTTDLTTLAPPALDEAWLPVEGTLDQVRGALIELRDRIERGNRRELVMHGLYSEESRVQRLAEVEAKIAELVAQVEPYRAEWNRRGGWSRAYLVLNHDGHVHTRTSCATCFPTTRFAVLYPLSGATDDQVIEHAKHMACTVCYPAAPVHRAFKLGEAEAAAAEAAKAAKRCAGSGTYDYPMDAGRGWARYVRCNVCRQTVARTPRGAIRAHNKPKSKS